MLSATRQPKSTPRPARTTSIRSAAQRPSPAGHASTPPPPTSITVGRHDDRHTWSCRPPSHGADHAAVHRSYVDGTSSPAGSTHDRRPVRHPDPDAGARHRDCIRPDDRTRHVNTDTSPNITCERTHRHGDRRRWHSSGSSGHRHDRYDRDRRRQRCYDANRQLPLKDGSVTVDRCRRPRPQSACQRVTADGGSHDDGSTATKCECRLNVRRHGDAVNDRRPRQMIDTTELVPPFAAVVKRCIASRVDSSLMTVDSGYYEGLRRGVEQEYAAGMAGNTYSQTLSRNRGNRDLSMMQVVVPTRRSPGSRRRSRNAGSVVAASVRGDATVDVELSRRLPTQLLGCAKQIWPTSCVASTCRRRRWGRNARRRWRISSCRRPGRFSSRRRTSRRLRGMLGGL